MVIMIKISPSILSADFANLERDIKAVEKAGVSYLHIDVMDGHFVPNITFGPGMVSAIKKVTNLVLDVHLMIENPEKYTCAFLEAGADILTVHSECNPDFEYIYGEVKKYGKKIAAAVNPDTDVNALMPYLDKLDMALVMSVNPGFGAQKFIESSIDKIRFLREKSSSLDIEVDGGIKLDNVQSVVNAGANVIVAGSAIFGADDITAAAVAFADKCRMA